MKGSQWTRPAANPLPYRPGKGRRVQEILWPIRQRIEGAFEARIERAQDQPIGGIHCASPRGTRLDQTTKDALPSP